MFWHTYGYTLENRAQLRSALLVAVSRDPENIEAVNALAFESIGEKNIGLATKLLIKSLEYDTVDNYKAFQGLAISNMISGLLLRIKQNGRLQKKSESKEIKEFGSSFFEKAFFYALNSQEVTSNKLAEKTLAILFYFIRDPEQTSLHFNNFLRYAKLS